MQGFHNVKYKTEGDMVEVSQINPDPKEVLYLQQEL